MQVNSGEDLLNRRLFDVRQGIHLLKGITDFCLEIPAGHLPQR
jgi:hypothetical protein